MYKYLCVISDNADKKDFYDTVEKLKNCYPDCRDAPEEKSDRSCLRRVMSITEKNVDKNICVRYNISERTVSVLSDIYLKKIFKGKEIENISVDLNKAVRIVFSIIFTVLNCAYFIILMLLNFLILSDFGVKWNLNLTISSAILSGIYVISAVILKKKTALTYGKIVFIQFGGGDVFIAAAIIFIILTILTLDLGWGLLFVCAYLVCYVSVVIPSLVLSVIFYGLLRLISNTVKNKLKGEDNYESKNRYKTRN